MKVHSLAILLSVCCYLPAFAQGGFFDDFNVDYNPNQWSTISGGIASIDCGSVDGNALYFNGGGFRQAVTRTVDTQDGGYVEFYLKIATGSFPCENADSGEEIQLSFTTDGGSNWTVINTYGVDDFPDFTLLLVPIPAAAQSANTQFRWSQIRNSGSTTDHWAIDRVLISVAPLDAGVTGLLAPVNFCPGDQTISAKITNFGTVAINDLTVNWEFDGVLQSPVSLSSTIEPIGTGNNQLAVNLGSKNFASGQTYDLKIWTSNPNSMVDTSTFNDTLQTSLRAALEGSYTIGGSSPDFSTFTDAVSTLAALGICDDVTFLVRSGLYNEQIRIPEIFGAGPDKTVNFRGETGNPSDVTLNYSSNSGANYTVRLDGADWLTLTGLTIEATNSTYGRALEIDGGAEHNTFDELILRGPVTSSISSARAVVFSDDTHLNPYNTFQNNTIENGAYGVYWDGNYDNANSRYESSLVFSNNQLRDQYYIGSYIREQSALNISDNSVSTNSQYTGFTGLYIEYAYDTTVIARNLIRSAVGGNGIYLFQVDGSNGATQLLHNNFIQLGGTGLSYGISLNSCDFLEVLYNSVNMTNTNPGSAAVYNSSSNSFTFFNNILSNEGGGYVLYSNTTPSALISDNNDLFTTGNQFAYVSGINLGGIAEWQSTYSLDANSLNVDPFFVSDTSYRVAQSNLNGRAVPVAYVATDIENTARDVAQPDIGCYEFTPLPIDAGIAGFTAPTPPFNAGQQDVIVQLKNHGTTALTSVAVNWQLNEDTPSTYNWTGNLAGGAVAEVNIGSANFDIGQAYQLRAWTGMPNGVNDQTAANDTASVSDLYAALDGVYTIGGTDPDFPDFTSAAFTLNNAGVLGPVTFNVRSGTYSEQIRLNEITGVSASNQIIFQSESGDSTSVTLSHSANSSANYTLRLNGADWTTFRNMTIEAVNSSYGQVVEIDGGADDNTFANNVLRGRSVSSSSSRYTLVYAISNYQNNRNTFINNKLLDGSYGIYFAGPSNNYTTGTRIIGNEIRNTYAQALYLQYHDQIEVLSNQISTNSAYSSFNGINLSYARDIRVEKNQISGAAAGYGMYFYWLRQNNTTDNRIVNNFVQIGGQSSFNATGIACYYVDDLQLNHNSVYVDEANSGEAFLVLYGANERVYNNIGYNAGSKGYAIRANNALSLCDHNDWYAPQSNLGYWESTGTTYSSLEDWQNTTNLDANSFSIDPEFIQPNSYEIFAPELNGKGTPLPTVTEDIEGNPRDGTAPDIGAYEFTPPAVDAGLETVVQPRSPFPSGVQPVEVVLKNYGLDPLTSATIGWQVNNSSNTYNWSGVLAAGQTDTLTLGTFDFLVRQTHNIEAVTLLPNGMTDLQPANDTARIDNLTPALSGVYTLGGTAPDFNTFTEAVEVLNNGGIVGPVTFLVRNGTYDEQIELFEIIGADSLRTVTFQSEQGDSSLVILTYSNPAPNNNYVLRLNGADWIRFQGMTVQSTNSSYSTLIQLVNGADHNIFQHNQLLAPGGNNNDYCLYLSDTWVSPYTPNEYNRIRNNRILGNEYGLFLNGDYHNSMASYTRGLEVTGNQLINQWGWSIYVSQHRTAKVLGNSITTNANSSGGYYGIYVISNDNAPEIANNTVNLESGQIGIYLQNVYGTAASPVILANNFVHLGVNTNSGGYGIYRSVGNDQLIAHNSVSITREGNGPIAFYTSSGSNNRLYNNIFSNKGGGYAYYYSGGISVSDHNNFYATGTNLAYYSGDRTDLADLITASQQDSASLSIDPLFLNDTTDLHTNNVALDKQGMPLSEISKDIDGDSRDPVNPDIGADEFSTAQDDAAAVAVNTPTEPFPADLLPVNVAILNNGLDTLQQLTINWRVNGQEQTPLFWTGSLLSGQSIDSLDIGTFAFEIDSTYDITVWTSDPNGNPDGDPRNDTTRVTGLVPALAGVYTIGGIDPDFTSFNAAVGALERGGVVDHVTFNVRPGTYNEQVSIPQIPNADEMRTITFQSESGDSSEVLLTFAATASNANYTLQLSGADWITFRHLTLEATGSTYAHVVDLQSGSHNNQFIGNQFTGNPGNSTTTNYALVFAAGAICDALTLSRNTFRYGSYGLYFDSGNYSDLLRVTDNRFVDQYYIALFAIDHYDAVVSRNRIISRSDATSDYDGICLADIFRSLEVRANQVINRNGNVGIDIEYDDSGTNNYALIANNFIKLEGAPTSNGAYGLIARSGDRMKILHNTVFISNTSAANEAFDHNGGSNIIVRNNIFANLGGGYAFHSASPTGILQSDHNNLYTNGTNIGYWNGNQETLADWQSASGFDGNSFSADPNFTDPESYLVTEIDLNGGGAPLPEVTTDIEGNPRDPVQPDIGAYEFDPVIENDAGVELVVFPNNQTPFASGNQPVRVALKNNGSNPLTSATVNWVVNGIIQPAYNWTGNLAPGERDTLQIGNFSFGFNAPNRIVSYSTMPNEMVDAALYNDTTVVKDLFAALSGAYTIGGIFPDFPSFNAAVDILNNGGVVGPVTFNVRNGTYDERVVIERINGASADHPITFQSESGNRALVILTHDGAYNSRYTLTLREADHLTFRNMTLASRDYFYGEVILLENRADYNTFSGNIIAATGGTYDPLVSTSSASLDQYNRFSGNLFQYGGYGLYLSGQSTSSREAGVVLEGNRFENQFYNPIQLRYQEAPAVNRNEFLENVNDQNYYAIYMYICDGPLQVLENRIALANGAGIKLQNCDAGPTAYGLIANNFVQTARDGLDQGINLDNCRYQKVYHNTVHITNAAAGSRALTLYSGSNLNIVNNIFAHAGGGYAYYTNTSGNVSLSDYNNFYSTGSYIGYWSGNNISALPSWRLVSGKDANSINTNPLFYSDSDLHVLQVALDSAGIVLTEIDTDIDGDPRDPAKPDIGADEFDYITDDLGVVALLAPVDNCELSAVAEVKIAIQNYGGVAQTGFPVSLRVNGGPIITEFVNALVLPGDTAHYTFQQTVDISAYQAFNFTIYTELGTELNLGNDTLETIVTNFRTPSPVTNMLPADGVINLFKPISFSWLPSQGAERYDLYLWPSNVAERPATARAANLTQIGYVENGNDLIFGQTYNWQVVAKNDYCSAESLVQSFTIRELPDLTVSNIQLPAGPFSGQTFQVNWQVTNTGIGGTGSRQWYDAVYLSVSGLLDGTETYLGGVANLTALGQGQSYNQSGTFTLPRGIQGTYYIIVRTDLYRNLEEGNEDNNVAFNNMNVNLTPPPDLQVTSIIPPNNAFSGQPINVNWTVTNEGTGPTERSTWHDRIYVSDSEIFNPNTATRLQTVYHNNGNLLDTGESYSKTQTVTLPEGIFGDYYIHIVTDFYNRVFEHVSEDNNTGTSTVINVILTPPPDLIVSQVIAPDSLSARQSFVVQWTVENQGASDATDPWYDRIYISKLDTFNASQSTALGTRYRSADLAAGGTYTVQQSFTAPSNFSGRYYLYAYADYSNRVFEFNQKDNNITRSDSVIISQPDLIVSQVNAPATGMSGMSLDVQWTVQNAGNGAVLNASVTDYVYLSTQATFNENAVTLLGQINYPLNLNPGATVNKQRTITLPNGISGSGYYILVRTDRNNQVNEGAAEDNNTNSDALNITLSPSPDLIVNNIGVLPDSVLAGTEIPLQFTVSNAGLGAATGSTWRDRLFISVEPTWNPNKAVFLKDIERLQSVDPGSSYTVNTDMTFPMLSLMVAGLDSFSYVYLYIYTDAKDEIYEHQLANENNIFRSEPVHVTCPPPVDLQVLQASSVTDTLASGDALSVQWTVRNIGSTTEYWNYPFWYDGFFLSTDTIWDAGDIFIKDFTEPGPLDEGVAYSDNQSFNLPNFAAGSYYLLLVADHQNRNRDGDRSNNTWVVPATAQGQEPTDDPQPIVIKQTLFSDLKANTFTAPLQGTSGQPIEVSWNVANLGDTIPTKNWVDKVYLSTDFKIDSKDIPILVEPQSQALPVGSNYSETLQAFIPIEVSGNFILLFKTDANNTLTEKNEGDNQLFTFITIEQPSPSDLIVESIQAPTMAMVNQKMDVSWVVRNQGQFPASGVQRDIVYLSQDTLLDPQDIRLGIKAVNSNLAPLSQETRSLEMTPTPGVPIGDYYLLVQTDALNNIFELVDSNNVGRAPEQIMITVPELPLDVVVPETLVDETGLYYRIEIPDSLAGETMLVTLAGDPVGGRNELYLSYGSTPSRAAHGFSYGNALQGDQEIVVPAVQAGTYYLLAYGSSLTDTEQAVELKAELIEFQIRSVNASRGGNTGSVTVKVEGAKFTKDMLLQLDDASLGTVFASRVYFVDGTKVFATFDLRGAELGLYDVVASKGGDTVELPDGFEVVEGAVGSFSGSEADGTGGNGGGFFCSVQNIGVDNQLGSNIQHPPNTRLNRVVPITIQFGNRGNVDVPMPCRFIISQAGAPLSFSPTDFEDNLQELFLEFKEPGGPPEVLRPGASGSVTIFTKAVAPLRFLLTN